MGDGVTLDEAEGLFGIEALHHDDGRADALEGRAVAERCAVVEGGWGEVDALLVAAEEADHEHRDARGRA